MLICVVGAGFSGAVVARSLADDGHVVTVIDERNHVAGNCHTERDVRTGILIHRFGPHIFHTDNDDVWAYMCRFGEMMPFTNRVKANVGGRIFGLPINLHTINQFFGTSFSPAQAREHISRVARSDIASPQNFEEQALKMIGEGLYRAFFHGYTCKQWGVEPSELPATLLNRLPLRFNYNDSYYNHRHQGIPHEGYTALVQSILAHERIDLRLGCGYEEYENTCDHLVYTGPLDRYYQYAQGRLGYRTLDFERIDCEGDYQGTAVMNYCDIEVPYTRIAEHQHFAPWEADEFRETVCFREYSRACMPDDTPFYPIRLVREKTVLAGYVERANQEKNVTFVGRLGTYSYLDMDVAIARALKAAEELKVAFERSQPPPVFVHSPL